MGIAEKELRWRMSCLVIMRSKIFERKVRLEIGR